MGHRSGPGGLALDTRLAELVGAKTARALSKGLNLVTARDLLWHTPRRYVQKGDLTALDALNDGDLVTVMAKVATVEKRSMRHRRGTMLEVVVSDGTASLQLTFFNQAWHDKQLLPGRAGMFAGRVSSFRGRKQLTHPTYVMVPVGSDADAEAAEAFAGELIPVYPATAELPSWRIDSAIQIVLNHVDWDRIVDPLPASVRRDRDLMGLPTAVRTIHRPKDLAEADSAMTRLRWDEAIALQLVLAQQRETFRAERAVARRTAESGLATRLQERLPFELTPGQVDVGAVVSDELGRTNPMHRLIHGEVGSGKTLVALLAMLQVVDAGGQAALLAPTAVLAMQHLRSLRAFLGPLGERGLLGGNASGTRIVVLTGSLSAAERRRALAEIADGTAGIVIGTHALLEPEVSFKDLGLVVIDEQHRFGVRQRAVLADGGSAGLLPHLLVMTATPIPRTVAMTVFGDLDVSVLSGAPAVRAGVVSHVVAATQRPAHLSRVWERVREEVAAGRQVFVVCPRIDDGVAPMPGSGDLDGGGESDDGDVADEPIHDADSGAQRALAAGSGVIQVSEYLANGPLRGLRLAALHGRLSADDKESIMTRFAAGLSDRDGIDVLVSTTVIEVGVDVPNATVMVIVDADRFGVSQLHQLRGRVGRGEQPGLCLLLTAAARGSSAMERLEVVASEPDGFRLARFDLVARGEGDVLGAIQAGRRSSLRTLSLLRDEEIIVGARQVANAIVAADPELLAHPGLADATARLLPAEADIWLDRS